MPSLLTDVLAVLQVHFHARLQHPQPSVPPVDLVEVQFWRVVVQFHPVGKQANDASDGVAWNENWAGAYLQKPNGTFNSITGTFTVPGISGPNGAGAAAWVGIDGIACGVILQAGVIATITSTGPAYAAVWEWYPGPSGAFQGNFTVAAGDNIKVTVSASNATSGLATIQNLSNQQSTTQYLQSSHELCGQNAEWIVEAYALNGTTGFNIVPLANFRTVVFTDAQAGGQGNQTFGPLGATIMGIQQNGQYLTNVSVTASSVVVKYV
ncbi:peptidase A4 family-domain-containing protein [Boletus edulis BED1]|uniref:Peptidase A4 family-domain-containing protein n=1 Tax=Boletus edulis BED1 TaxID=1328754 RepID=A0AAD4BPH1_BOLED|nr:peptidase A4 family-domain-containing protein [Boletus edulis BED1]